MLEAAPARQAQQTVLHRVAREYLPAFIEQAEAGDHSVPAFVKGELDAFLCCGDPASGFTHIRLPASPMLRANARAFRRCPRQLQN